MIQPLWKSKYWILLDLGNTVPSNYTGHKKLNFIYVLELVIVIWKSIHLNRIFKFLWTFSVVAVIVSSLPFTSFSIMQNTFRRQTVSIKICSDPKIVAHRETSFKDSLNKNVINVNINLILPKGRFNCLLLSSWPISIWGASISSFSLFSSFTLYSLFFLFGFYYNFIFWIQV